MCDTIVALKNATKNNSVIFGKNSDREPIEPHIIVHLPFKKHPEGSKVKCTYIEIDQVSKTYECILFKPSWIWGAEMGVNEYGVVIGNEAIFTKEKQNNKALLGMDILRLALERSENAFDAVDVCIEMIEKYGQGGNCGYKKSLHYHNSYLIVDFNEAYVLESADKVWVVKKIEDFYSISNSISIKDDYNFSSFNKEDKLNKLIKEQVKTEKWNQGDRIRAVISKVTKDTRIPQIQLSRASEEMLKRLFEMEVPEIYDGTVVIKSAARDPGERSKIAVASNEKDVDPVGACVGVKGSRVQNVIKELRGEKIDIIQWSQEPSIFAANALSPARVTQVQITDIEKRKMKVIVPEDQLSLAIGKKGQNVRLAAQLVGWDIDIVSEEEIKKEISMKMGAMMVEGKAVPLSALGVVSPTQAEELKRRNIADIETLAKLTIDDLADILDVSMDEAQKILDAAKSVIAAKEEISSKKEESKAETEQ